MWPNLVPESRNRCLLAPPIESKITANPANRWVACGHFPLVSRACNSEKDQSEDSISLIRIVASKVRTWNSGRFASAASDSFASCLTHGVSIMNGTAARFLRLGVSLSGLVVLGWVLTGQAAKPA